MSLKPTEREPFARMFHAVSALYGRDLSADVVEIYWQALAAYDLSAVRQALDRHVKNPDSGQFMPKPADIIRMLGGTTQDAAMAAWAKVEKALRLVGGYTSITFDDPVIHAVIRDMGGWIKLTETKVDDLPFRAKEFEARYRGFAMRREIPSYPARLIGRTEAENKSRGFDVFDVALFGEPDTCRQVIANAQDRDELKITYGMGHGADIAQITYRPRVTA